MSKKGHDDLHPVAGIPDDVMDKLQAVAGDNEKVIRAADLKHKQAVESFAHAALQIKKEEKGKFPTRGIRHQSRWATYRPEFRKALRTLARLRSGRCFDTLKYLR